MNNYKNIIEKYPELFEFEEGSQEPFPLFGFECGIGWYNIIDNACKVIYSSYKNCKRNLNYYEECIEEGEAYVDRMVTKHFNDKEEYTRKQIKEHLNELHTKALKELEQAKAKLPKVVQAKEKFGTLRLYIEGGEDAAYQITSYAEYMSETTCEVCGGLGKTYTIGWHRTLCKEHAIAQYGEDKIKEYRENE